MAKKKNQWKGGPRSSRSYIMDLHRASKEPWEVSQQKKGKRGKTHVKLHYRDVKRGSTKVKGHTRKYK